MRRLSATLLLVLAIALAGAGCAADVARRAGSSGNFTFEQARHFRDFPLYAPGESYGELPLTALNRAFDRSADAPPVRSNYVDFVYGTCDASAGGCAPPLAVQVWAACERNPMVYAPEAGQEAPIEVRGVPAYFYEGGRRLELSTGTSTVVIFAADRAAALAAAAALRGVNNPVTPAQHLPAPAYARDEGGVTSVIPCAYEDPTQQIAQDPEQASRVGRALRDELTAGAARRDNEPVRSVDCFRSPVPARVGAVIDAHECAITWKDGSGVTWCVLSGEDDLLRATAPDGCEEAAESDSAFGAAVNPASDAVGRWATHAEVVCARWRSREGEAMATMDQDLVASDFSYVWFVLRPYEVGLVSDIRVIPGRGGAAQRALVVYKSRLADIDAGLRQWQRGKRTKALQLFDRAEKRTPLLSRLFEEAGAGACAPT